MDTLLATLATTKLSPRNATEELRRHLVGYLRTSGLEPGARLATEAEMVQALQVSRSTIRRALDPLEREGWIDRRAGSGTYVGRRVRDLVVATTTPAAPAAPAADDFVRARRLRGIVRVAVLIYRIGDLAHDWYTPRVLQGLDDSGDEYKIAVELLGDRDSDVEAISRRLELSRPDALVCLSNKPRHAFVIRDAQKMGIHCFVSGTPLAGLGVSSVSEDNAQAMTLAVRHLLDRGHQRVALALPRLVEPWVFDRLDAYNREMLSAGFAPLIHWTASDRSSPDDLAALKQFLDTSRATAIVPAHSVSMELLDRLTASGGVRVPGDLSVVTFEQDQSDRAYLGHPKATRIVFPFQQMGHCLAMMARNAVDAGAMPEEHVVLPAELVEGTTIAPAYATPSA